MKALTTWQKATALAAAGVMPLAVALAPPATASGSRDHRVVELRDDCDPITFNAALGPGFCTRTNGSVSLDEFQDALHEGGHGAWWNRNRELTLELGDTLRARNVGGIVHTFTKVGSYGKGCVPPFNVAVRETTDNCDPDEFEDTLLPQGQTSDHLHVREGHVLDLGVHRFQCLIHPWMRTTVTVRR